MNLRPLGLVVPEPSGRTSRIIFPNVRLPTTLKIVAHIPLVSREPGEPNRECIEMTNQRSVLHVTLDLHRSGPHLAVCVLTRRQKLVNSDEDHVAVANRQSDWT